MSRIQPSGQIISGHQVRVAAQPIVVTERSLDGAPQVQLKRDGNRIKEIHIRCGCGELIILDCEYDLAPTPTASPRPAPSR